MAQVSSQAGLTAALNARDPQIQIVGDFSINSQISVTYPVTISSPSADSAYTITRGGTYYSYLIRIRDGGALTLENIIFDGRKENLPPGDITNRSLLLLAGGTLSVGNGTVVRNNSAYQEGGGIYMSGDVSYANTLIMEGNATVTGCSSRTSGGGVMIALRSNMDQVTIGGEVEISDNTALNGGGLYCRSYLAGVGVPLTIGGSLKILRNTAAQAGGGIYVSSFTGGGSTAVPFTINGPVQVQENQAQNGGGVYYNGVNAGDGITIGAGAAIRLNQAAGNGGGVYYNNNQDAGSGLLMTAAVIHGNSAVERGGGFYNTGGSRSEIDGTEISANKAGIGGGIYNNRGGIVRLSHNTLISENLPNTATQYAPGVYNEAVLETADRLDLSNGLYLASRASAVSIIRAMEPGTAISLNESSYVTPNREGTPIIVAEAAGGYPVLQQQDAEAFQKPVTGFEGWEIRLGDDHRQVWLAPVEYTITYENLMGASNQNPVSYQVTSPTIRLSDPGPLPGYRFLGWYDENGNQVREIVQGTIGNKTFWARWEQILHTIQYLPNDAGGSPAGNIPEPVQIPDGQSAELSELIPFREGYRFTGWNTKPDGSGTGYRPGEIISSITGEITLYAQWETFVLAVRTIRYQANDSCCPPAGCIPEPVEVEDGQSIVLSRMIPVRCGYCFTGWNTLRDGSGVWYCPDQTIEYVGGDITLYAQWWPVSCCCNLRTK